MDTSDRSRLLGLLRTRQRGVAKSWYEAVARTGLSPLGAAELRERFAEMTKQATTLLVTEPFDGREARALGASLAGLHLLTPEIVSKTQEVLTRELTHGLRTDQAVLLQARLLALLSEVAAGFFERARGTILNEQERIKAALLEEREQAEEALRRSEASLAEAQRIAHLGHWEHDLDRNELRWSDEIFRIFGLDERRFGATLEAFRERVHPSDLELVDRLGGRAAFEGKPTSFEHRIVRPGGEIRVVHQRVEAMLDSVSRPIRLLGTVQDVTERKALEEQLKHQALHDPLTGLPNRVLFMERLEHALVRVDRRGDSVAVLFMDLDNFKVINDSLGHECGDQLLVGVTKRLSACLRAEDTAARLGGDEFIILLEDVAGISEAIQVADRVTKELRAPFTLWGQEVFVTTSIGVVLNASPQDRPEDLVRNADMAMYQAKGRGKARYEVFDPSINVQALRRLELENSLRKAIEREEFEVYYQPKVSLATGRITDMEALVRWEHPQRGLISSTEFVPLAEETGLIVPMGWWVLKEACGQVCDWQERYPSVSPLRLCVNLSARQFQNPALVEDVARVLEETGMNTSGLELEITESILMDYASSTVTTLRELKSLGVRVVIDDFGKGYSSLSYLKRFPVDALKIDRSFVGGLGKNSEDEALVSAIISLASALGMETIAEGVETADQRSCLLELGCKKAQGYYFSEPLSSEAAGALLAKGSLP